MRDYLDQPAAERDNTKTYEEYVSDKRLREIHEATTKSKD